MATDIERLGVFYLGRLVDPESGKTTDEPLLYDSRRLTTHAVCVGMTGSGKTGLLLSILEEAAIDGVPAIALDPKGDLGNLLLSFPELRGSDFRPWVDPEEAERLGRSPEDHAEKTAEQWRAGLAEWGQDPARIRRFKDAAEVSIYTPGSASGRPISVLRSLAAPPAAVLDDADSFRERVSSTASGLLALLGIAADPLRSREHVLLATLLDRAWRAGESLDLPTLVRAVATPPFDRVGVLDIESFYPSSARAGLATAMNALLAAPGFSAWTEGEPLDVSRLLRTPDGRPRVSVVHLAHLSDAERTFFVTLLLNEVVGWMRSQSGTGSLRAILCMDEIHGFFPPVAVPPTKPPMLTLLKQGRAVGLGVVLATQNPADLDYKGLANAGTWFLGRLQTERDKARVIEGLEGASAASGLGFDRAETERRLAGLGHRVFLVNDVREEAPFLFQTRWLLSYLRGPLTRDQVRALSGGAGGGRATEAARAPAREAGPPVESPPPAPAGVPVVFLPTRVTGRLRYRPAVLGSARLHFVDAKSSLDEWRTVHLLAPLDESSEGPDWASASDVPGERPDVRPAPEPGASFSPLPSAAGRAASFEAWRRSLADRLYQDRTLDLRASGRERSAPGESESDFVARLEQARRERRDAEVERLRGKYATKAASLEERIRKAEERVEREKTQYGQQKMQTGISFAATIFGVLLGRRSSRIGSVGRATTTARGAGRTMKERQDVALATENVEDLRRQLAAIKAEAEREAEALRASLDEQAHVQVVPVRPRKGDVSVGTMSLAWVPWVEEEGGLLRPASAVS